ncbi:hypothetical protein AAG570_004224 [Ranatra chinensis]|uniref:UBX domain-containing protein n=1 Tax=Ranatra chinensis TaxID=642074 RepID=A0ABD0Y388_9HEMI
MPCEWKITNFFYLQGLSVCFLYLLKFVSRCGKLFKSSLEVQYHAAKSGHSSFAESTEEKKPLTEEEKQQQLKLLESKIKEKRKEREEKEKNEALEREKNRIRSGKEMIAAKKKLEDEEFRKAIEQRKREKEEDRMARQKVRDQIEADKLARKAKQASGGGSSQAEAPVISPPAPTEAPKLVAAPAKDYAETRLQIRLTNGQALTQSFGAKEQLSAVRLFVEMNRTDDQGPFCLMTNFPKKVFTDEDFDKPLDILGKFIILLNHHLAAHKVIIPLMHKVYICPKKMDSHRYKFFCLSL